MDGATHCSLVVSCSPAWQCGDRQLDWSSSHTRYPASPLHCTALCSSPPEDWSPVWPRTPAPVLNPEPDLFELLNR